MKMLRVLSISRMSFISLSPSFLHIQTLSTHDSSFCELRDISILGELKRLQILNLSYSSISELQIEIEKLHNLRFLDLTGCRNLYLVPSGVIKGMSHLEGLHMVDFGHWHPREEYRERLNASLEELSFFYLN